MKEIQSITEFFSGIGNETKKGETLQRLSQIRYFAESTYSNECCKVTESFRFVQEMRRFFSGVLLCRS